VKAAQKACWAGGFSASAFGFGAGGTQTEGVSTPPSALVLDGPRVLRDLLAYAQAQAQGGRGLVLHLNNLENLSEADADRAADLLRSVRDQAHTQIRSVFSDPQVLQPLALEDVQQLLANRYAALQLGPGQAWRAPVEDAVVVHGQGRWWLISGRRVAPMESDRAGQAVETQGTHRSDGVEVGVEAHQYGVVVQGHGGHQQVETEDGAADPATGLAQGDRLPPQIRWCAQQGQGVELGLQQPGFLRTGGTEQLESHRFRQVGGRIEHVGRDELLQGSRAAGPGEVDPEAGVEQQGHEAIS
jgi:hypothetical protein